MNPTQKTSSGLFLPSIYLVLAAILLLGYAEVAAANVPSILEIENISQGSAGKVKLQIAHANPSAGHYVDVVEVQVAGATTQFNQQPQSSDPFTVELDLGELQGTPAVKARAHCNLHGWSEWSQAIVVPEFSTVAIVATVLLAATLVLRAGNTIRQAQKQSD